ncbi:MULTISPECIES: beta-ketoacyl-ACP synthase III [Dermacoccus]|uniref:Beta-ketoacyl-[acyl-carrier-protein] synthase III n=1 Tax=Dermacoccus abyssi TaxID=322596 RepID=A0ABX5Z967_9MICO|nr:MULTISPECIES: beta-ketoacyl-ACP synthase III [Dermacoccus]MBE7371173.1 ketoacyl-ACP synthase III [Dermacoccus barathri]QEH93487.1 ketoacyl-ACP synthase III [Dermacoccus abyssi]RYI21996.1 ketoacyl-ACP synthase III [Dermacoccus sp. 147Ba]
MATITQRTGAEFTRVLGVGAYRPERLVTNDEIVGPIDSSDEWIQERSGIKTRRFARPEETMLDMAEAAAREAIANSGIDPSLIDGVLVGSVTHHLFTPAAAPMLADRLGLDKPAAIDIAAACAGYCFGIGLASDMIRSGDASHVLVIGAEKLTDVLDLTDRGSAFIFGDGAGAAVVGPSDHVGIGPTIWGSDGSGWESIRQVGEGHQADPKITMAGQSVFRWAVWSMAPVALQAVEAAGLTPDDIDVFIPHQANTRIIDAMVKQMKLPEHVKVARDIVDMANTSAASVPLAAERMIREGQAKSGDIALQIGFGAGLAYAAQVIEIP